jgi:hypothetical protein
VKEASVRLFALAAAAALMFATPTLAADVTVRPMTVDAALQKKFDQDYGVREVGVLEKIVARALERELTRAGASVVEGAPVAVEVTLVDVKPSKPTLRQSMDRPGLDVMRSVSIGGAELRGRIVGADGATLREVSYEWYEHDLLFSAALSTWADAHTAIRRFAGKVGEAYRETGS